MATPEATTEANPHAIPELMAIPEANSHAPPELMDTPEANSHAPPELMDTPEANSHAPPELMDTPEANPHAIPELTAIPEANSHAPPELMDTPEANPHAIGKGTKRPRCDLSLRDKYEIALFVEENPEAKRKDIATRFSIPGSTLSRLASNVEKIKKAYEENIIGSSSKRMRKPLFEDVDMSLLAWFNHVRSTRPDFPINGSVLLDKANEHASLNGYERRVSMSWINRWKNRHQISFKKSIGESSINPELCIKVEAEEFTTLPISSDLNDTSGTHSHVNSNDTYPHVNSDIVASDNDTETGLLTDQNILKLHVVVPEDDDDETQESSPVTANDAFHAVNTLQRFFIDKPESTSFLSMLTKIESFIEQNFRT